MHFLRNFELLLFKSFQTVYHVMTYVVNYKKYYNFFSTELGNNILLEPVKKNI